MPQQVFVPKLKKHQKKSLASALKIEMPQYTLSANDTPAKVDVSQYIRNRIVSQEDTSIYYRLKNTRLILSAAVLKSIFHEYFDNVLSYDQISKLFKMPESMIRQLIDLAY